MRPPVVVSFAIVVLALATPTGASARRLAAESREASAQVRPEGLDPERWTESRRFSGLGSPNAAARDAASGRLAVGDRSAVWVALPGAPAATVLRRGAVLDLAFGSDGVLWVAGERGLVRIAPGGGAEPLATGLGREGRRVGRVVSRAGVTACGTRVGAFVGRDSQPGFVPVPGLSRDEVTALALESPTPARQTHRLWLVQKGRLLRATLGATASEPALAVALPGAPGRVVDVATHGANGVDVLTERSLLRFRDAAWTGLPLSPPPGSELLGLDRVGDVLFVKSDRGLLRLVGDRLERELPPAGHRTVSRVIGDERRLFAVSATGLLYRARAAPARPLGSPARLELPRDPDVEALRTAVLRYLDLDPGRMRALWRGARHRGWLPSLELRGAYGGRRGRSHDYDETFSFGEPRLYHDRDFDRSRDFDVGAVLRWELGDVVYEPESVDVSREAREVIELRDDVLDEVIQLYFDRQRAMATWAASTDAAERRRLALRARELAAGLDAWSGGWFGLHAARLPEARSVPVRPPTPAQESSAPSPGTEMLP